MTWQSYKIDKVIEIEEIYSLFCADYNYNYTFPGEAHNFWECLYVTKGEICVSADGKVYNLKEHEIIFHKPLEFHKFTVTDNNGASALVLSFSMNKSLASYFNNKVFHLSDNQNSILKDLVEYAESKVSSKAAHSAYEKYLEAFESHPYYAQTVALHIYRLLFSLLDANILCCTSGEEDAKDFEKSITFMNSNINTNITISDIASHLNVSASTVKRLFLKYAGISVHKYFIKLKLKSATELLLMGTGVTETAEKLGFSSQGYFSGLYKKETGIAPSEIKQKSRDTIPELSNLFSQNL